MALSLDEVVVIVAILIDHLGETPAETENPYRSR